MVYKPCPQCGKSNHHNKVKCTECGVCLRAKPGRPNLQKSESPGLIGRPCKPIDVLCPSCGHSNDLCRVTKCSICDQNLVGKAGRPEVLLRTCSSCGHVNEAKRISCSECECALIVPCPLCGKMN